MTKAPILPRRIAFLVLAFAIMGGLFWLAWATLAPGGWTVAEILILVCIAGTLPWAALSAGNALIGLGILLLARDPAAAVLPALATARPGLPQARTAIAICIRREDMALVLPPLARLLAGLAGAGAADRFSLWFLSDTPEGTEASAEEEACRAFAAAQPIATHYRRRAQNTGFKSGNVMEFLDHHAGGHEFMLCLDADSEMTADAVLRLVACMEADPKLAILQQLIHGRPTTAGFPRLFQFGMRHGMRSWATGQAWWQGDEGPYWGHNAVIRIAPFRTHARLETLPDGSHILSHDQVEATRLHAAGWKVRVLPDDAGSSEGNPPSYSDFITRDLRWAAGNMQYLALLRLPGLTPMARWQLIQAILLFLSAPFYVAILLLAAVNGLTGGGDFTPIGALLALLFAGWCCHYGAKLAGYAEVLLKPDLAARYGGRAQFLRGALAEMIFTAFMEPARLMSQCLFLLVLPFGMRMGWAPQNRSERGISFADALKQFWAPTLAGLALSFVFAAVSLTALLIAAPVLISLLGVIPFAMLTANPRFSAWLVRQRICALPEEIHGN
ncbi:MAG: glucans biosynthesis glucosyltransferase MdoH [Roseomonas sp.]|nr:glucans biosynthesis glucosyltransferase MdoH [Roseomonas sp.]MCA3289317.1 glucans biosynthesis glucosyltransferase MdoH [Roseomonas sp.]MCA3294324.1 glucans biosynthesis glucosyltransferase MdoH [Roseomonas sp.]